MRTQTNYCFKFWLVKLALINLEYNYVFYILKSYYLKKQYLLLKLLCMVTSCDIINYIISLFSNLKVIGITFLLFLKVKNSTRLYEYQVFWCIFQYAFLKKVL